MQGKDGNLYGTASVGGTGFGGTIFKVKPDGTEFAVLKNFNTNSITGGYLYAPLIGGPDGTLYGTATQTLNSTGTVLKLKPDGGDFTVLKRLDWPTGGYSYGGVLLGTDGMLYGTAQVGGSYSHGSVFKLNTNGLAFTILHNFDSANGSSPYAALLQARDGNLYGTTVLGGKYNGGTVFRFCQNSNDPPLASAARPTAPILWPPNHRLVAVAILGVSDPDNDPVTIIIDKVTQDEPTHGLGGGDTAIDAVINGDGTVLLRAERLGSGDGRVYRIYFTAADGGSSASGVVVVTVPQSVTKPAIDSGGDFDSTQ